MRIIDKWLLGTQIRMKNALEDFVESEQGDTNFISMLLIIGIVVVLAGLFLKLARDGVMTPVARKVEGFVDGL